MDDLISRHHVEIKLKELVNEMEEIFSHIREKNVDDSVCGLCEYDCDHGLDGYANECPGFEKDDCFKLKEKYRSEWISTKDLPSVQPERKSVTINADSNEIKVTNCNYKDTIYRQDAIDAVGSMLRRKFGIGGDLAEITLAGLPSAYPEQRADYARGYNDAKREIALSGEYERAYQRGKADAQPERKKGKWVGVHAYCDYLNEEAKANGKTERYLPSGMVIGVYCNKCWCRADKKSDFCPNCGSYNGGEQE